MSEATIGVIGTLLGTIIGFVLSEVRNCITQHQKRKWIKQLVGREINYNLEELESVEEGVKLPTRSTQIWDSQLESMPGVLDETEFEATHNFYIGLHNVHKSAGESKIATSETVELSNKLRGTGNPLRT